MKCHDKMILIYFAFCNNLRSLYNVYAVIFRKFFFCCQSSIFNCFIMFMISTKQWVIVMFEQSTVTDILQIVPSARQTYAQARWVGLGLHHVVQAGLNNQ